MYCFYVKTATFFRATWVRSVLILNFVLTTVVKDYNITGKLQKNITFA